MKCKWVKVSEHRGYDVTRLVRVFRELEKFGAPVIMNTGTVTVWVDIAQHPNIMTWLWLKYTDELMILERHDSYPARNPIVCITANMD